MAEFVRNQGIKGFSLSKTKFHLENQFPSLRGIDPSTVSRILRENLGLSFKKLGGTNAKKIQPESKSNQISWVKAVLNLLIQRYRLVFIDEFVINRKTQNTYDEHSVGNQEDYWREQWISKWVFIFYTANPKWKVWWEGDRVSIKLNTTYFSKNWSLSLRWMII